MESTATTTRQGNPDFIRPEGVLDKSKTLWLQGVGETLGVHASELQVGDNMVWNGGGTSQVLAIVPKGKQSLVVTEESFYGGKWNVNTRTFRKNRVVAVKFDNKIIRTYRTKSQL